MPLRHADIIFRFLLLRYAFAYCHAAYTLRHAAF